MKDRIFRVLFVVFLVALTIGLLANQSKDGLFVAARNMLRSIGWFEGVEEQKKVTTNNQKRADQLRERYEEVGRQREYLFNNVQQLANIARESGRLQQEHQRALLEKRQDDLATAEQQLFEHYSDLQRQQQQIVERLNLQMNRNVATSYNPAHMSSFIQSVEERNQTLQNILSERLTQLDQQRQKLIDEIEDESRRLRDQQQDKIADNDRKLDKLRDDNYTAQQRIAEARQNLEDQKQLMEQRVSDQLLRNRQQIEDQRLRGL